MSELQPLRDRVEQHVPLAPMTTLGVGGTARRFVRAGTEADIADAVSLAADDLRVPLFVLGGGSNLLVADTEFPGLVLQPALRHIDTSTTGRVTAGAGVSWDALVDHAVERGFAGIECLAGIPGTVGGTPVQNVGAYGQEVAGTIASVRAYDREQRCFVNLDRTACRFRYRQSVFNTEQPGRWIVTAVTFQLQPGGPPALVYADLRRHFAARLAAACDDAAQLPTLAEAAAAVRTIRREKGMVLDPADPDTHSAGSFFRNPLVSNARLPAIAAAAAVGDVPHWPVADSDLSKLPAAWLLERAGFVRGWSVPGGNGRVALSSKHTLAVTNRGGASFHDVAELEAAIVAGVMARFGITLEREPVLLEGKSVPLER